MKEKISPYLPGIVLFVVTLLLGLAVYKDYGMSWDEPLQRDPTLKSWDYIFKGDMSLFTTETDNHGAGFELVLLGLEKKMNLTDSRDIYIMRHLVTHLLYVLSCFAGYVLIYRLFRDKWIAVVGYLMLTFAPRLYAHSFFNTKDLPFLCMVLVGLAFTQLAFDKRKWWWFLLGGLAFGYGTSIRIMGVLYALLVGVMLLIDLILDLKAKKKPTNVLASMGVFTLGFCAILYLSWPYLWREPVAKFVESFAALAHFKFMGSVYFQGQFIPAYEVPWTYFPTWFLITTPILWLIAGFAGLVWILFHFTRHAKDYIANGTDRNLMLYLLCFVLPIVAVIGMHSVIYDDWRHLYFVYPPFVILGLYPINKLYKTKLKWGVLGLCGLQLLLVANFMILNHPHEQVYFNSLTKQEDEYLRSQYDMEYWGCSFKQALDNLAETDPSPKITVSGNFSFPLKNNVMMLKPDVRRRFVVTDTPDRADYFLTNFRMHPGDYPSNNIQYEIRLCNSTIMRVYKIKNAVPQVPARQ